MKNFKIWLLFLLVVFISGCVQKNSINFTNIALETRAFKDSKIYAKFRNTSSVDSNLTAVFVDNLRRDGYSVVSSESMADISIKGNLEYFRRTIIKDRDPFLEYCIDTIWNDCYDKRTNSYVYDAQITLLINNEATTLNFISHKNINSLSTMMEIFNDEIYNSIISMLKG